MTPHEHWAVERSDPIDACFQTLLAALSGDEELARSFRESWVEFSPGTAWPGAHGSPGSEAELACRRHLEWFLLEKTRLTPLEPRIDALLERCLRAAGDSAEEVLDSLRDSHASLFEVARVEPGRKLWLWDLAGLYECAADEPGASLVLSAGDVIAGRIFPFADSQCRLSRAAVMWRDPQLLSAIRRDMEQARARRPSGQHGGLRLGQAAIEALFHAAPAKSRLSPGRTSANAVAAARELLAASDVEALLIDSVLERLAEEPPVERAMLPGSGDVLGEILEELAFESDVDLEAARRALLLAWAELHAEPEPPRAPLEAPAPSDCRDVASAVAEFDRQRTLGQPLETVFRNLEKDLGLAELEGEDEDTPAPDFPGVVAAMIEEFLWDVAREDGPAAARRFEGLRSLGRFAQGVGVFENLTGRELGAYACRWLPESRELADAQAARDLLDGIARFCDWAQANHEVLLASQFAPLLRSLASSLPRVVEANRLCPRRPEPDEDGWFEYVAPAGAAAILRDRSGAPVTLALDPGIEACLRPGDVLRGRREDPGRLRISTCFPGEIRQLESA